MRKTWLAALALVAALVIAACGAPQSTPQGASPSASGAAQSVAAPEAGKATVVGRVVDSKTGAALTDTPIRLAEVFREGGNGAYILDGGRSPGGITTSDGGFTIPNITAREYVVVVGDALANHVVITDTSGKARIWDAQAGKVLDVGVLSVDLLAGTASVK